MATQLNGKLATPIVFENISRHALDILIDEAEDLGLNIDSDISIDYGDYPFSVAVGTSKKFDISMNSRKEYYREKFPRAKFVIGTSEDVRIALAAIQDALDASKQIREEAARPVYTDIPKTEITAAPRVEPVMEFTPGISIVEVYEEGRIVKVRADKAKLRELFMSGKGIVSIQ